MTLTIDSWGDSTSAKFASGLRDRLIRGGTEEAFDENAVLRFVAAG